MNTRHRKAVPCQPHTKCTYLHSGCHFKIGEQGAGDCKNFFFGVIGV
jgi:hypothetical protein